MKHSILRLLAGLAIVLALSFSSNPPNGRTGAPGDGLCSDCHSAGAQQGNVMITGVPTTVTPGQTYTITVTSTTTTGSVLAGFQMLALHDDGNINAGSMSNPSAASTITVVGSGRSYHEHQPAMGFGGGDMVSWSVDWEAPLSGPDGDITFYAASVLANGNSTNGGDGVVTSNVSGDFTGLTPLDAQITASSDVTCNGGDDGSATVMATGGTPTYMYLWSNGETTATATMLPAGLATVTVTDVNAQTATASVQIDEPAAIDPTVTVVNHITCNGDGDGQAMSSPSGGTGPYMFLWSNGQTTATATGLDAGLVSVTVTDDNGCTATGSTTIDEPDILTLELVTQTDISCFGFNDGTATVAGDGGTAPYTYNWPDGQNGTTAVNLGPGVQTVTVTDNNLCTEVLDVNIQQPDELILSVTNQQNVSCFGGSDGSATVSAVGGTMPYDYMWSDGQTGATASNLIAAVYTCMVTDANGCQDMVVVNISQPMDITIDLDITHESAPGANDGSIVATPMGGNSPYDYEWSNGASGAANINLPPGTYMVTVTDANDCEKTASGTVMGSGCDLTVDIVVIQDLDCPNDVNGVLTYNANMDVASVSWSTASMADTIFGLAANNYSITVTGTDGCMANAMTTLSGSDTQMPEYILDTLCLFLDHNGMAVLDSAAFFANLQDNCDPNPGALFTNLEVDCDDVGIFDQEYSVGDASGNIGAATLYLIVIDTISPTIACPADITVNSCDTINYVLPTADDNCPGVQVNLLSGLGSGQLFPVGTTTESYEAVDQFGNRAVCSFSVTVISDLANEMSTVDASCSYSSDGSALTMTTGGTAPYSFSLTPNGDISMLAAGEYIIEIVDATGCTLLDTFVIDAPDSLMLDSLIIIDATVGNFDGSIEINVVGGTSPYEFAWFRDTMPYSMEEDLFNLFSDYYSVVVTDANDCVFTVDSIFVDELSNAYNQQVLEELVTLYSYGKTLFVEVSPELGSYEIELYHVNGRQVRMYHDLDGKNNMLALDDLSDGYYLAKLKLNDGRAIVKSIILNQ